MSIVNQPRPTPSTSQLPEGFVRRKPSSSRYQSAGIERRQFPNSGVDLSEDAVELANAIDIYKHQNGIQKINTQQLLNVIQSLNYSKLG